MNKIDNLLAKETALSENLRVFCLKLIRSKERSLRDVFVKYININKGQWLQRMREHFKTEDTPKQFNIPPEVSQQPIDLIIKRFQDSGYKDIKIVEEMFKLKEPLNRYKMYTFFMTDVYPGLCGQEQRAALHKYIAERLEDENLLSFEKLLV